MNDEKPLRILVVISHPWDVRLGAPRVYMELAEQWRSSGHIVEKFCLSDAFPSDPGSGAKFLLRQFFFAYKAAAFIRNNADRFDVVDALVGDLPFPKSKLGFRGLLVARSMGLPQLYDQFEKSIPANWPARGRGSLSGRLFYDWARARRVRTSEKALRYADIINLPNLHEAEQVKKKRSAASVIVQPYGLTDRRREELKEKAAAPDVRLAEKRVCFIGMWGARKGAYDWPRIVALIRAEVADARFLFLGTMVEPERIKTALARHADGIETLSDYQPDQLPDLIARCTVGAFPSHVEGFGLAVLEQLGAGIPTVAFDIPGPRDILGEGNCDLLVPRGDLCAFTNAIVQILRTDPQSYRQLGERSREAASKYSWRTIADATAATYRAALVEKSSPALIFAQPFAFTSPGGGARILRALLQDSPLNVALVCTSPDASQIRDPLRETHIPRRPYFGRIERSRWHGLPETITPWLRRSFRQRLVEFCRERRALGLHAIPHGGLDFHDSYLVAKELGLPYFLQVHDDLLYSGKGWLNLSAASRALKEVWTGAQARFVISEAMGEEYARRYGKQDFVIITDGLERVASRPVESDPDELRIYFMGLFHISYEENVRALLGAIRRAQAARPSLRVSVTLRCGELSARDLAQATNVHVLPFAAEAEVETDLGKADLLYLPLPFGADFEAFVRLSFSTKLITYLGSGVPILYHGPRGAAVGDLLERNDAAFCQSSLDVDSLAALLARECSDGALRERKTANALALAKRSFMLEDQRTKFWHAIKAFLPSRAETNLPALACRA